ncbi:MAG: hypothetical protein L0G62_00805 [Micrococcaceae bacterium]|nr:hypothetical protein [Micrococcaceae bacterium]
MAFDLLSHSTLLREHVAVGKVILGVNHTMSDFATKRRKDLDLVFARPGSSGTAAEGSTFVSLAERFGINLSKSELETLLALPDVQVAPVGSVLIAMEAKATMTAHNKARPRLYDELSSSHLCIHGESEAALAIAYAQVNGSDEFVSPNPVNVDRMQQGLLPVVSRHNQPKDTQGVIDKLASLRSRNNSRETGFDAIGVTVLNMRNDGSPVTVMSGGPAPRPGDALHYDTMIMRMATRYDTEFGRI